MAEDHKDQSDTVRLDILIKAVEQIYKKLDVMESDLVTDRSKLDKMQISLDTIKTYLETVDLRHKKTQENITKDVSAALQPLADMAKTNKQPTMGGIRRLARYFKGGVSK